MVHNAIQKEMDSLRKHNVCKLVKMSSVPKEEKIIGLRFVFKQKVDGRFKARLVVQGYVQEAGVDYGRSYAPVCRIGSIRTVLAIACEHGWPVWQMDVVVAFLQSHIDKDVYVKPAPGHDPRAHRLICLIRHRSGFFPPYDVKSNVCTQQRMKKA